MISHYCFISKVINFLSFSYIYMYTVFCHLQSFYVFEILFSIRLYPNNPIIYPFNHGVWDQKMKGTLSSNGIIV